MRNTNKEQVLNYVQTQIARGENRLRAYVKDEQNNFYPKRIAYNTLHAFINDFSGRKHRDPRWITIPGLRGTGKTTLLAQIYTDLRVPNSRKLYITLDDVVRNLGASLKDVISAYEELLGTAFEKLQEPVYLFIDEVQYDDNWGLFLKTLYDRSSNIFIICTGSAAISLQTNADIARRAFFIKLYPLDFSEYVFIKLGKKPVNKLQGKIQSILLRSATAVDVFNGLSKLRKEVLTYWRDIDPLEVDAYLKYGTLPFTINIKQESFIYAQINQTLNYILTKDVAQLNTFDAITISKLGQILYMIADSDKVSLNTIANAVTINPKTLTSVFSAFEKSEILMRIYPYGTHYKQVRKPSKYLFSSSAYRSMYYNLIDSSSPYQRYKGKLLEDIVGMYLHRLCTQAIDMSLAYDSAEEGADFIIDRRVDTKKKLIIEVGSGEKGFHQVINTLMKIGGEYGLVISQTELKLDKEHACVSVPLQYFLLA